MRFCDRGSVYMRDVVRIFVSFLFLCYFTYLFMCCLFSLFIHMFLIYCTQYIISISH